MRLAKYLIEEYAEEVKADAERKKKVEKTIRQKQISLDKLKYMRGISRTRVYNNKIKDLRTSVKTLKKETEK